MFKILVIVETASKQAILSQLKQELVQKKYVKYLKGNMPKIRQRYFADFI
jgi:hypothetical protein